MKKLLSFCLLLITFFLYTNHAFVANDETDLRLYARSAVLMDAQSGRILYEENANAVMPMASTTKIMTCIIALEEGNLEDIVTVSENATKQPKVKLYLKEGRQYLLKDLLYSLMLESHNDTAVAIAEHIGIDVEGFAKKMNEKALSLQCEHTNFITPNGLDDTKNGVMHSSTASDMARITAYALQNKEFCEIIATTSHTFCDIKGEITHSVQNKDAFLTMYKGAIGVKTGFTGGAGYCFVGAAERDEKKLITVVLASGWPPNKSWKWKDTITLMDYGMENYEYQKIESTFKSTKIPVEQGQEETVEVRKQDKSVEMLLSEADRVEVVVKIESMLTAPVEEGSCVGYEEYYVNQELMEQIPIYTMKRIEEFTFWFSVNKLLHCYLL